MPHWLFPSMYPTWQRDENGNIVLLKIPKSLDLDPPGQPHTPQTIARTCSIRSGRLDYSNASAKSVVQQDSVRPCFVKPLAALSSLPTEVLYLILDYLPPVDRVCLALTCKALCSIVIAAPRLGPSTWATFLPRPTGSCTGDSHDLYLYYSPNSYYGGQMPESYTLLQRLAHGWIPKNKLRYCWKCHRILSRNPEFWTRRIKGGKKPKWDIRTSCGKDEWNRMSTNERFQHLIDVWCKASFEDSSILSCDGCREEVYAENNGTTRRQKSLHKTRIHPIQGRLTELQSVYVDLIDDTPTRPAPVYRPFTHASNHGAAGNSSTIRENHTRLSPKLQVRAKQAQPRYTVECPACLERQLTFTFRLPRRPVVRTFLRDCWFNGWKYLWKAVWLVGTIIVAILTVIYTLMSLLCSTFVKGIVKARVKVHDLLGNRWKFWS